MRLQTCPEPSGPQDAATLDTAGAEPPLPEDLVPVAVLVERTACARPADRDRLGPYVEWTSPDWEAQPVVVVAEGQPATAGWGVAIEDFDGDGQLDLYLPHHHSHMLWLAGAAGMGFQPLAMPDLGDLKASGAVAGDMDGDGDPDLVLAGGRPMVLRNDGGANFHPIPPPFALDALSGGSFSTALGDVDQDGDLDVIIPMMGDPAGMAVGARTSPAQPSFVALNRGNGELDLDLGAFPASTVDGHPFTAVLTDVDLDQDLDLYFVFDHGHQVVPNRLWRAQAAGFEDGGAGSGLDLAMNAMGLALGDVNADGLPDFAITGIGEVALLESEAGPSGALPTWIRTDLARGLIPDEAAGQQVGWGADFGDVDNDGDLDLWVGFGHKTGYSLDQTDALYLRAGSLAEPDQGYEDVAEGWAVGHPGPTRGGLLVDLNADGWLDLVTRQVDGRARIWQARCGDSAWIELSLAQPGANPQAVGARVEIHHDGQILSRELRAGGASLASGGPARLHFGLGEIDRIDQHWISWPDGRLSVVQDVPARAHIQVRRERAPDP